MPQEFEAKFLNIDVIATRKKLRAHGAKLVHAPIKFYRVIFKRCEESGDKPGFVRIRDEGKKITMTTKIFNDKKFPEECEVTINESFDKGVAFLKAIGIDEKSYQETMREKWSHPLAHEITIDIIPGLPIYMEVDCTSEAKLNQLVSLLDLNKKDMRYGSFDKTFTEYYDIPSDTVIHKTKTLTFKNASRELNPVKNTPLFREITRLQKSIHEKRMDRFYKDYKKTIYERFLSDKIHGKTIKKRRSKPNTTKSRRRL